MVVFIYIHRQRDEKRRQQSSQSVFDEEQKLKINHDIILILTIQFFTKQLKLSIFNGKTRPT